MVSATSLLDDALAKLSPTPAVASPAPVAPVAPQPALPPATPSAPSASALFDDAMGKLNERLGGEPAPAPAAPAYRLPDAPSMSSPAVERPRSSNPLSASALLDDALARIKPPQLDPGHPNEQPSTLSAVPRSFFGGLIAENPKLAGEAMEGFGEVFGADWLKDSGTSLSEWGKQQGKPYERRVPSITDVKDVSTFGTYIGESLGQGLASIAPGLLAGGATALVTANPVVGLVVGATAPSYVQNYGDVYGALKEDDGVRAKLAEGALTRRDLAKIGMAAAAPMAALDALSVGGILKSFVGEARKELQRAFVRRVAMGIAKGAGTESVTEALQEVISQATQAGVGETDLLTWQRAIKVLDGAIGGLLTGGAVGGTAGALSRPAEPQARAGAAAQQTDPSRVQVDLESTYRPDLGATTEPGAAPPARPGAPARTEPAPAADIAPAPSPGLGTPITPTAPPTIGSTVTILPEGGDGPETGTVAELYSLGSDGTPGIRIVDGEGRAIVDDRLDRVQFVELRPVEKQPAPGTKDAAMAAEQEAEAPAGDAAMPGAPSALEIPAAIIPQPDPAATGIAAPEIGAPPSGAAAIVSGALENPVMPLGDAPAEIAAPAPEIGAAISPTAAIAPETPAPVAPPAAVADPVADVVRAAPPPVLPQPPVAVVGPGDEAPVNIEMPAARPRPTPRDLLAFLASIGGIREQFGELRNMGLRDLFVPGFGALVRPTGQFHDRARELAAEAGFLPSDSTLSDLYELLDRAYRGGRKIRLPDDQDRFDARDDARRAREEADDAAEAAQEIAALAARDRLTLTDDEKWAALNYMMLDRTMTAEDAVSAVLDETALAWESQHAEGLQPATAEPIPLSEGADATADARDLGAGEEAGADGGSAQGRADGGSPAGEQPRSAGRGPEAAGAGAPAPDRPEAAGDAEGAGRPGGLSPVVERDGAGWRVTIGSTTYRGDQGKPFRTEREARAFAERRAAEPAPTATDRTSEGEQPILGGLGLASVTPEQKEAERKRKAAEAERAARVARGEGPDLADLAEFEAKKAERGETVRPPDDEAAPAAPTQEPAPEAGSSVSGDGGRSRRRGEIGMTLAAGERVLTATGRETTPFPKVDVTTAGRTTKTSRRVDQWLMQNAVEEARARNDEFNLRTLEARAAKPSPADKDLAERYLFDSDVAPIPRPILKPAEPAETTQESAPAQSDKPSQLSREYLEEQRAKTVAAMSNPSLRGTDLAYLKARLSAIDGKLDALSKTEPTAPVEPMPEATRAEPPTVEPVPAEAAATAKPLSKSELDWYLSAMRDQRKPKPPTLKSYSGNLYWSRLRPLGFGFPVKGEHFPDNDRLIQTAEPIPLAQLSQLELVPVTLPAKIAALKEAWERTPGAKPDRFELRRDPLPDGTVRGVSITRTAKYAEDAGAQYQVTTFDENGFSGDMQEKSLDDAIKTAIGFDAVEPDPGLLSTLRKLDTFDRPPPSMVADLKAMGHSDAEIADMSFVQARELVDDAALKKVKTPTADGVPAKKRLEALNVEIANAAKGDGVAYDRLIVERGDEIRTLVTEARAENGGRRDSYVDGIADALARAEQSPRRATPAAEPEVESAAIAPAAEKSPEQSKRRGKVTGAAMIEDAGEKIGGARKDRWKERGLALSDLDGMTAGEEFQYVTKENVWPAIDYAARVADGMEPKAAALLKILRDKIATKPTRDSAAGRRDFIKMVTWVRELAEQAKAVADIEAIDRTITQDRLDWGEKWRDQPTRDLLRSIWSGNRSPLRINYADRDRADKMVAKGFPGKVEPWQRKFVVREATDGTFFVTPPKGRQLLKDGFTTRDEAVEWAKAQHAEQSADEGDGGKLPTRPHLDRIERTGEDIRAGRDVTGDDFISDFGFRGVEFGNWVASDERQKSVNLAYDALHDLARVLSIPPKALSLNGALGLAFGARGTGRAAAHYEPGKLVINLTKMSGAGSLAHEWAHALDHYFGELNVDKGTRGETRGASGWYGRTEQRESYLKNLRPEMAKAFDRVMSAIWTRQKTQAEAVRETELALEKVQADIARVEKWMRDLTAAEAEKKGLWASSPGMARKQLKDWQTWLDQSGRTRERVLQARLAKQRDEADAQFGKAKSSYFEEATKLSGKSGEKGYWTRPTEMFARAFESYVFDKIKDAGNVSQYLVQGVEPDRYASGFKGNPYPTGMEREAINAAFDALFADMQTREGKDGRPALFQAAEAPITGTPPTAPEAEIQRQIKRGVAAMDVALRDKKDRHRAMFRPEMGWISFLWGKPGTEARDYEDGAGVAHILARRTSQGLDGEAFARSVPEAIARGNLGPWYLSQRKRLQRNIVHNGITVGLTPNYFGKRLTWVMTAYPGELFVPEWGRVVSDAEAAAHLPSETATQAPVAYPENLGAETTDQDVGQPEPDGKTQRPSRAEEPKTDQTVAKQIATNVRAVYSLDPGYAKARQRLEREVLRLLRKLAPGAKLDIAHGLLGKSDGKWQEIWGSFHTDQAGLGLLDHIIAVSLRSPDPLGTARHETIHFLRRTGLLDDALWAKLEAEAPAWRKRYNVDKRWPGLSETEKTEEAIAEAYMAWARGKLDAGPLTRAFRRIAAFFDGLREAVRRVLGKEADARDIFAMIEKGRLQKGARTEAAAGAEAMPAMMHAAWHGSPHDFERFDLGKIGTGEGAQAYGHGLYFAGKQAVAEFYRDKLTGRSETQQAQDVADALAETAADSPWDATYTAVNYVDEHYAPADRSETKAGVRYTFDDGTALLVRPDNSVEVTDDRPKGRLYKVDLAPAESDYLDWDKPLSEQSDKVRAAVRAVAEQHNIHGVRGMLDRGDGAYTVEATSGGGLFRVIHPGGWEVASFRSREKAEAAARERTADWLQNDAKFGSRAYGAIAAALGTNRAASEALLAAGIPGIRYLDGSSRGKGEGSSNYVIFDDSLVKVEAKFQMRDTEDAMRAALGPNGEGLIRRSNTVTRRLLDRIWGDSKVPAGISVTEPGTAQDLSVLKRWAWTPSRAFARYPELAKVVKDGIDAEIRQSVLINRLTKEFSELRKGLDAETKAKVDEALWAWDAEGVDPTREQLTASGLSQAEAKSYEDHRTLLEKIGRLVDQHRRKMMPQVRERKQAIRDQLESLARSARVMDDAEFRKLYGRKAHLTRKLKAGADPEPIVAELDALEARLRAIRMADPALQERFEALRAEYDLLESRLQQTSVRKREGYVPHKFYGSWRVWEKAGEDQDGKPSWREITSDQGFYDSRSDALEAARAHLKANPDAELKVEPKQIQWPFNHEGTQLSDAAYGRFVQNLAKVAGLEGAQLKEAIDGVARKRFRRRVYAPGQFRSGAEGFARDIERVMLTHIGQAVRYTVMDEMKFKAITAQERAGLSPYKRVSQENKTLQDAFEAWWRDFNGEKQPLENQVDAVLSHRLMSPLRTAMVTGAAGFLGGTAVINPVFGLAMGGYLGWRTYRGLSKGGDFKSRAVTGQILGDVAHLKLGAFTNLGSAVVNLSQTIVDTYPVLGEKYTAVGLKRASQALLAMARGKQTEDVSVLRRLDIDPKFKFAESSAHLFDTETKLARASMFFFNSAETLNRSVAALGAYHRAIDKGSSHGAAVREAQQVVTRTQFHYGPSNKPELLRNVFARVPLQFKNFMTQQLAFTFGLRGAEIPRFLLGLALVSGLLGLPFLQIADWLLEKLSGVSLIQWIKDRAIDAMAYGELPGSIASTLARGFPALFGVDVSGRTGMGEKFLPSGADALGPWFNTIASAAELEKNGATLTDHLANLSSGLGSPLKALEAAANGIPLEWGIPRAAVTFAQTGDAGKALQSMGLADGKAAVTNPRLKGQLEYEPSEGDLAKKAVGLRPLYESQLGDVRSGAKRDEDKAREKARPYLAEITRASRLADGDALIDAAIRRAEGAGVSLSRQQIRQALKDADTDRTTRALKRVGRERREAPMDRQALLEQSYGR